jgi:hypothetical protein
MRRSISDDLSVSRNSQRQVLRSPQRKGTHGHLLTGDQPSGISGGLTHARLGIGGTESCVEETPSPAVDRNGRGLHPEP